MLLPQASAAITLYRSLHKLNHKSSNGQANLIPLPSMDRPVQRQDFFFVPWKKKPCQIVWTKSSNPLPSIQVIQVRWRWGSILPCSLGLFSLSVLRADVELLICSFKKGGASQRPPWPISPNREARSSMSSNVIHRRNNRLTHLCSRQEGNWGGARCARLGSES
jgi:hypothetical protein